jgi:nucleotide-binding universal stress UspA family protein
MPPTIIVGYDGSEQGHDAIQLGCRLVRATGARLILANVYLGYIGPQVGKGDITGYVRIVKRDAERTLAEAPCGEHAELRAVDAMSSARGLQELAEETGAELIVIGSSSRGKWGLITMGSTGEALLHGAPCAVAVAPAGYAQDSTARPGRIAVGYEGTDEARLALAAAIDVARAFEAKLSVITVAPPMRYGADEYRHAQRRIRRKQLDDAMELIPDDVEAEAVFTEGSPEEALKEQTDVDLLVVGSRGYGHVRGVLLGSVSDKLVRGASSPVLVVPRDTALALGGTPSELATA